MDKSKHETEIAALKPQIDALKGQMDNTSLQFLEATGTFLAAWFQNTVEHAVTSHPVSAQKASEDGRLSRLKTDLAELVEKTPEEVKNALGKDNLWLHRQDLPQSNTPYTSNYDLLLVYDVHGNRLPDKLGDVIRSLFGLAGKLITEYGFDEDEGKGKMWRVEYGQSSPRYTYGYQCSSDMLEIMGQYSKEYKELLELNDKVRSAKRAISEIDAKKLWDQA